MEETPDTKTAGFKVTLQLSLLALKRLSSRLLKQSKVGTAGRFGTLKTDENKWKLPHAMSGCNF